MAILLSDSIWEGVSTETKPNIGTGGRNGHFFKELDTGETYLLRNGVWDFVNLGFSFIRATKSGRATTNATGDWSITFATPFIDDQYSIALSCEDPGIPPGYIAYFHTRTKFGFSVKTRNFAGAVKGNVPFSYLATRDYDPAVP